jgi:uncharacterized protein YbaP (TraB family)
MKRSTLSLFAALVVVGLLSSLPVEAREPLLWAIEHPDAQGEEGPVVSYLFGSIHLPDARVKKLGTMVDRALDEADALYTEIDMANAQGAAMMLMMNPNGKTIYEILTPEQAKRVDAALAKMGIDATPFQYFKVWAIYVTVSMQMMMKGNIGTPLDMELYYRGVSGGKTVGGLETAEEQIGAFDAFSLEEQVAMLEEGVDMLITEDVDAMYEELIDAYLSGDPKKILELTNKTMAEMDDKKMAEKFMEELITKRDKRLAERMVEKMKASPDDSHFFVVGAAHMAMKDSVLYHLKRLGYNVERVGKKSAAPSKTRAADKSPQSSSDNASPAEKPVMIMSP